MASHPKTGTKISRNEKTTAESRKKNLDTITQIGNPFLAFSCCIIQPSFIFRPDKVVRRWFIGEFTMFSSPVCVYDWYDVRAPPIYNTPVPMRNSRTKRGLTFTPTTSPELTHLLGARYIHFTLLRRSPLPYLHSTI